MIPSRNDLTYFRGRVALYAILKALNIGPGDEIITQAFTCSAVPEGIIASGAIPVYADLPSTGFNMDINDLERKITEKTRAIIAQHTYGIPADMHGIADIAPRHDLPIIEDCCHTLNSKFAEKIVGSFGVASFYSYEWGKPIVVGLGGGAIVNKRELLTKMQEHYVHYQFPPSFNLLRIQLQYLAHRILYRPFLFWPTQSLYRWLGSLGAAEKNYTPIKENSISNDFSLKMSKHLQKRLIRKSTCFESFTRHNRWVTNQYRTGIDSSVVTCPAPSKDYDIIYARYPLLTKCKKEIISQACKANVELAEWYSGPIHPVPKKDWHLMHYEEGSCPNTEARCSEVVTLPTHKAVTKRDINRTIRFLNQFT